MSGVRAAEAATRALGLAFAVLLGIAPVAGCEFHELSNKQRCSGTKPCKAGYMCKQNFCLPIGDASSANGGAKHDANAGDAGPSMQDSGKRDAGGDAGKDAASSMGSDAAADAGRKQACTDAGATQFCFDGDPKLAAMKDVPCKAGTQTCEETATGLFYGSCLGQVLPIDEVCNGLDDDCDGTTDEMAPASCMADNAQGACTMGTLTCDKGVARCLAVVEPTAETCNGLDDDCDGNIDEGTDMPCYSMNPQGCTSTDPSTCTGACKPGKQRCQKGMLQTECTGEVPPMTEACSTVGAAADEDCDGNIDEGCSCTTNGSMQDCYTGPSGTETNGTCHHGTQTCTGGAFGPCTGSVTPVAETCLNEGADDNCDGTPDNVPMKGDPCTVDAQGVCHNGMLMCQSGKKDPVCVTPSPAAQEACDGRDDDCDGLTDEGFDLQNDPMHCGSCGNACPQGQMCCMGECADLQTDPKHCGACVNAACGSGLTCCGGACANLASAKDNCGICGHGCAPNESCCDNQCVNLQMDDANCNACGHACNTDTHCCSGGCVDLLKDNNNCGTCGHKCGLTGGVTCNCNGSGMCSGICI